MTNTYFIGIGGTGLSAIARVLIERGEKVSGSDNTASKNTQILMNLGANIHLNHHPDHVIGADLVVRSSAIPDDHPEVQKALSLGIEVLKRKDFLPQVIINQQTIGIAGTHGKTSTAAMLAYFLSELNTDPSYIVGGKVINLGNNAHSGKGEYFIIEADEYDHMFWGLSPKIAIITNVEHDHPDIFPTPEDFDNAFKGFIDRIVADGILIACQDDEGARKMIDYARSIGKEVITYGVSPESDYRINKKLETLSGNQIELFYKNELLLTSQILVLGHHNVLNSVAAFATLHQLGFSPQDFAGLGKTFKGAGRRFDILGEVNQMMVVNDYGHHPTEIKTTLEGARNRYPNRRIWAVWQPHTFSRSLRYQAEFSTCFSDADLAVVLEVFASRETKPEDFHLNEYVKNIDHPQISHQGDFDQTCQYISAQVLPKDIIIVFSAGDAPLLSTNLLKTLTEMEESNG